MPRYRFYGNYARGSATGSFFLINMAVQCWLDLLKAAKKTALISDGIYFFILAILL